MENRVILGDLASPIMVFDGGYIRSINYTSNVDVVGSELSIDVFTPTVDYPYTPDSYQIVGGVDFLGIYSNDGYLMCTNKQYIDLRATPYGTPIWFYRDSELRVKAYVKNVDRLGIGTFRINSMSAIGLLDAQAHYGNLYNGQTFAAVLAEIIDGSVNYTVAANVASIVIYGWLPYATKRENLHQLLFAYGVMVGKNADGDMDFRFLSNEAQTEIPDSRIYINGSVDYSSPATTAEVTEHSFISLASDETVTEFDNTDGSVAANSTLVVFKNAPLHDLTVTGTLTIVESGVNYAIVTGVGTLTGKKYTHSTRVVRVDADNAGSLPENVATSDGCTLVSVTNSENVAARLLAYYGSKKTVSASIVLNSESPGMMVTTTDPFGETISGFISRIDAVVSSIIKGVCRIITDYVPTGGNNYTQSEVISTSGTWTATKTGKHQITICSGGQGGQGGHCGKPNFNGTSSSVAGGGGEASSGGAGGRVVTFTIDLTVGDTLVFSFGSGGGGGTGAARCPYNKWNDPPQPTDGANGADTTVSQNGEVIYSTANGVPAPYGITDIFTNTTYALSGANGRVGASGGERGQRGEDYADGAYLWRGGAANTAGGGGAAYGNNGGAAYPIYDEGEIDGYKGGDGADATQKVIAAGLGEGGAGGNAGGGGGQAVHGTFWTSLTAYGGAGANGNTGGAGFALIYS